MSEVYKHVCIKPDCGNPYEDNEVDAYYCPSCVEQNKQIAQEIDKKAKSRPQNAPKSSLQRYDELRKQNGGKFPHISQLGIKL